MKRAIIGQGSACFKSAPLVTLVIGGAGTSWAHGCAFARNIRHTAGAQSLRRYLNVPHVTAANHAPRASKRAVVPFDSES